jgi:galactose oxidase
MNIGRGYAGSVMNADGTVFTLGGSFSGVGLGNRTGELWTSGQGWSLLPGVPPAGILTADAGGPFRSDNHAWLHVLSGGRLLHAGPSKQMNWINPRANNGSGSITSAGLRGDDADSMNGSSVAYDVDQLLKVGGSPSYGNDALQSPATRSTQLIDASGSTPAVRRIAPMAYARAFSNAVALPNGQVVVVGGQTLAHPSVDDNAVMVPEIWDPATQVFERLPAMAVPRTYHSTAILLPDGRVWVGGGGLCGACAATHLNHEILTPPYLLDDDGTPADRPVITSVSRSTLALGDTLQLRLATPAASFALMRLSSVTHSVNSDQRRIPLTGTTSDGARYNLSLPSDPGVVTPGYYMVFAMNAKGTPSMAQTIRITAR